MNYGLQNELNIIKYINKHKYTNFMGENLRCFINYIFGRDMKNCLVTAKKYIHNYKPDIIIESCNTRKYISIKTGKDNSVHHEHIHSFINFLDELEVDKDTQEKLKLFHFNDTTRNGSGKERGSSIHFQNEHKETINQINYAFNANKYMILERILFNGEYYNLPKVEFIYHGNENKGYWASKEEIMEYLMNNNNTINTLHISKICYQSYNRNLNRNMIYEYRRYYAQFKWHTIEKDLINITSKRKKG